MPSTARLDRRDFLKRTAAGTSGLVIGFYLGPSIMSRFFPGSVKNGLDNSSVEDLAELKYSIPNFSRDYVLTEAGIPVGFWRSVGNSQNGYIAGCFVDEMAKAGGKIPSNFAASSSLTLLGIAPSSNSPQTKPLGASRFPPGVTAASRSSNPLEVTSPKWRRSASIAKPTRCRCIASSRRWIAAAM
jgi:hypothetical protein